jgi:hypothetical protein
VSRGLVLEQDLDLHVFPIAATNKSHGELILDGGKGNKTDYCFLAFKQENETITVTDMTEPHGGQPKSGCGAYKGQTFTTLYLYDYKHLAPGTNGYQSARVNGDSYLMDLIEVDTNEYVGVFTLTSNATFNGKLKLSDIKTIEFSQTIHPAP